MPYMPVRTTVPKASSIKSNSARRSVLSLEKNGHQFEEQLREACSILGIDLESLSLKSEADAFKSGPQREELRGCVEGPRFEWTLKWLLNKLRADLDLGSPCLLHQTWDLLRFLIKNVHALKVAQIFISHKYLDTLRRTLLWLREHSTTESLFGAENTSGSNSDDRKASKKRKRGVSEFAAHEPSSTFSEDLSALILSICETLFQAQCLLDLQLESSQTLIAEQLKAALKCNPEEAADFVSNGFCLLQIVSRRRLWADKSVSNNKHYEIATWSNTNLISCTKVISKLWRMQFGSIVEVDHSLFRAFTKHSLIPTLHLLQYFQSNLEREDLMETQTIVLESLIAANVIEPIRKSFNVGADDLFANLREVLDRASHASFFPNLSEPNGSQKAHVQDPQHQISEVAPFTLLMCSLFEIAISSSPKETAKARKEVIPFLRRLFDEIKECLAFQLCPEASSSHQTEFYKALRFLLNQAVQHDVQLNMATIVSISEQVLGSSHEIANQQVEWDLISLCLKSNADVFIIPNGVISGHDPDRRPNDLLTKLFAKLSVSSSKKSCSNSNQLYNLKLEGLLIPLLQAFANARDLQGFFKHWTEQLNITQENEMHLSFTQSSDSTSQSMWEDDDLLYAAQGLLEQRLSTNQVDEILERIEQNLNESATIETRKMRTSNLMVLDCVVGGFQSEDSKIKLLPRARSVFVSLASAFLEWPQSFQGPKWRVWRILATINRKWYNFEDWSLPMSIHRQLAETALTTINTLDGEQGIDIAPNFQEKTFAFLMMTSLLPLGNIREELAEELRTILNMSVNRILDSKGSLCQRLSDDKSNFRNPSESLQSWSGKAFDIQSCDSFYLSCIVKLLSEPDILSYIDIATQRRMLEQLNLLARHERCSKRSLDAAMGFSWLWTFAQDCEAICESNNFAEMIHHLNCVSFVNLVGSVDSDDLEFVSEEYEKALEGVLHAPLFQLSGEDIISVANAVLDVLRRWTHVPIGSLTKNIQLLVKLSNAPKKAAKRLKVFQDIQKEEDPSKERSAVFVLAEIVSQFASSAEIPSCNEALCRLTEIILNHIYATLETKSSAKYLTLFYQWLEGEMHLAYTNAKIHSVGWTLNGSMLLVTMTALNYHRDHCEQAAQVSGTGNTGHDRLREQHLEYIIDLCSNGSYNWRSASGQSQLAAVMECLFGYIDILTAHRERRTLCQNLSKFIDDIEIIWQEEIVSQSYDWNVYGPHQLRANFFKLAYKLPVFEDHPDGTAAVLLTRANMVKREYRGRVLCYFQVSVPTLDIASINQLLLTLPMDYQRHLIMGLTDIQMESVRHCVTQKFLALCRELQGIKQPEETLLGLRYLSVVLRKWPKYMSQYIIETLLSTIHIYASKLAMRSRQDHDAKLFIGLSRVFSTVLYYHRRRLGGRYHLTIPALQSLLRLLFVPFAHVTASVRSRTTFSPIHARAYARLLTTLCDPSPSAVKPLKHCQHTNLNDETKRAKDMAGQHLHYLVKTYCDCRISGRFAAEGMKEALEPGLWAVLGCMGEDIRRTMNAGMDSHERAVWKRLSEDWKQFGQWQAGERS